MPPRQFTAEQQAEALARIALGESSNAVSKSMGISRSTIRGWSRSANPSAMVTPVQTQTFATEVMGLASDYVTTLRSVLRESQSPNWIKAQTGDDLARFLDSVFGQLASLGAAIERGQDLAAANAERRITGGAGAPDGPGPLEAN